MKLSLNKNMPAMFVLSVVIMTAACSPKDPSAAAPADEQKKITAEVKVMNKDELNDAQTYLSKNIEQERVKGAFADMIAIFQSQQRYYMASGKFTNKFSDLDIGDSFGSETAFGGFTLSMVPAGRHITVSAARNKDGQTLYTMFMEGDSSSRPKFSCKNGTMQVCASVEAFFASFQS